MATTLLPTETQINAGKETDNFSIPYYAQNNFIVKVIGATNTDNIKIDQLVMDIPGIIDLDELEQESNWGKISFNGLEPVLNHDTTVIEFDSIGYYRFRRENLTPGNVIKLVISNVQ